MPGTSTQTPLPRLASFADLLAIPEEQRHHEILDGEIVRKAMAGGEHGLSQLCVGRLLDPFGRKPNGSARPGGWWLVSDVEVELAPHEVVRPDVVGWRRERMPDRPHGFPIRLRPDWVCEIMTDGDARRRDGLQKRRIYADCGIPHYWLLDTERERLTVLRLSASGYVEVLAAARGDRARAEPFDVLELQIGVLFGDDAE